MNKCGKIKVGLVAYAIIMSHLYPIRIDSKESYEGINFYYKKEDRLV